MDKNPKCDVCGKSLADTKWWLCRDEIRVEDPETGFAVSFQGNKVYCLCEKHHEIKRGQPIIKQYMSPEELADYIRTMSKASINRNPRLILALCNCLSGLKKES